MLLSEFQAAKVDKTTNNIIVNVKVHKTKRKYGSAQVVLTPDMNTQMRCYVDVFRDKVARMNEKDPLDPGSCLFVTWSFKSLNGFSTQLDSFWKKATKSNRQCPVSATLIRKSITTTFYASEEINDSIKDRLANHMKHKRETASRNYNLYKTMTNAAELTNQIENKLLKTSIINSENFSNNFTSENLSDNIKLPTECISDESTSKRGWNGDEILEVKRLFQHHDFQGCYIPYIREKIKDNLILKRKSPKAIYDKLLSITKSANTSEKKNRGEKMDAQDKRFLMVIFKKEIMRDISTSENSVNEKLMRTTHGKELLNKYGLHKIINKIRYEKNALKQSL
nr:uncharacterized protein LOC124806467 [Hydra vulgaris]